MKRIIILFVLVAAAAEALAEKPMPTLEAVFGIWKEQPDPTLSPPSGSMESGRPKASTVTCGRS